MVHWSCVGAHHPASHAISMHRLKSDVLFAAVQGCDVLAGLYGDSLKADMGYAISDASDDDRGRGRSSSRSRSRSRSRIQTPEPLLKSPALSTKCTALPKTPLRAAAAAKSPRAAAFSPVAVSKSPRLAQQGFSDASNSSMVDNRLLEKEHRPGRLGSIGRLQRLHQRGNSGIRLSDAATTSDAVCQPSQGVQPPISAKITTPGAWSPGGILRRSRSSTLAGDMLRTRARWEQEADCQQPVRAASTPPGGAQSDRGLPSRSKRHRPQLQHHLEAQSRQPDPDPQPRAPHIEASASVHSMHGAVDQPAQRVLHSHQQHDQIMSQHQASTASLTLGQATMQPSLPADDKVWPHAEQHGQRDLSMFLPKRHQLAPAKSEPASLVLQPAVANARAFYEDAPPRSPVLAVQSQDQSAQPDSTHSAWPRVTAQPPRTAKQTPMKPSQHLQSGMLLQKIEIGFELHADHDDALKVQRLCVTPHKPPRQLSGNPFAEPTFTESQHPDVHQHAVSHRLADPAGSQQQPGRDHQLPLHAVTSARHHQQAHVTANAHHMTKHVTMHTEQAQQVAQLDQRVSHTQQQCQIGCTAELSQAGQTAPSEGLCLDTPAACQTACVVHSDIAELSTNEAAVSSSREVGAGLREHSTAGNGGVPSRSLLDSLEQEAVAADEEACLQELQVRTCLCMMSFTCQSLQHKVSDSFS